MKYSYWSEKEDDIIKANYPVGGAKSCTELLPYRTVNAITTRANKLNVKKVANSPKKVINKVYNHASYIQELKAKNIQYIPLEYYINTSTNINHQCFICNHIWKVCPSNILKNRGCPECAKQNSKTHPGGYNETRFLNDKILAEAKGICYLVVLIDKSTNIRTCLKIGITKGTSNADIRKRAAGIKEYEVRLLKSYKGSLEEMFKLEQKLHDKWKHLKYIPEKKFAGYTECFELNDLIIKTFPSID